MRIQYQYWRLGSKPNGCEVIMLMPTALSIKVMGLCSHEKRLSLESSNYRRIKKGPTSSNYAELSLCSHSRLCHVKRDNVLRPPSRPIRPDKIMAHTESMCLQMRKDIKAKDMWSQI